MMRISVANEHSVTPTAAVFVYSNHSDGHWGSDDIH